jgi:hypothetical protein
MSEIKKQINEEMTKDEKRIFLSSSEFEDKIEKIVKAKLKNNKELEDKVVEITRNVIAQLYKTLWLKKAVWQSGVVNKK